MPNQLYINYNNINDYDYNNDHNDDDNDYDFNNDHNYRKYNNILNTIESGLL